MIRLRKIREILWWVLLLNFLVAVAKWGYGFLTHSISMQADGLHSFFDGLFQRRRLDRDSPCHTPT